MGLARVLWLAYQGRFYACCGHSRASNTSRLRIATRSWWQSRRSTRASISLTRCTWRAVRVLPDSRRSTNGWQTGKGSCAGCHPWSCWSDPARRIYADASERQRMPRVEGTRNVSYLPGRHERQVSGTGIESVSWGRSVVATQAALEPHERCRGPRHQRRSPWPRRQALHQHLHRIDSRLWCRRRGESRARVRSRRHPAAWRWPRAAPALARR